MIEVLQKIAAAQGVLSNLQLTLIEEQETPRLLQKAADIAASAEKLSASLVTDLREMAGSMLLEEEGNRILTKHFATLGEDFDG